LNIWEAAYRSTEEVGGKDSIQFRVFNPSRNTYDSGYVKLSIADVNDLPELAAISNQQMEEDGTLSLNLSFDDPDNELSVFAVSNEASNLVTSIVGNTLTLTGKNDFNGLVNVNVWVEEVGTAEEYLRLQNFVVDVRPVNDSPTMVQVARLVELEDVTITVPLSASDKDTELQVFSFNGYVDDPNLAILAISGNTLKVIPVEDAYGVTTVHITVSDGGTSASSTSEMSFEVEFTAVNDAPKIVKSMETQVLGEGFPAYDINLSGFFSDPETANDQLTYSVVANSLVSVAFVNSIATISTVGSGTSDVTFIVSDGEFSTEMVVTFVVNAQSTNLAVANSVGEIPLSEDFGDYTIDVSNVFKDNNDVNAIFEYSIIGNSFIGAVVDNANGTVTFQSQLNYSGTESIVLIGTSGGQSMFVQFDLVIDAVNDAPLLGAIANQSILEDGALTNLLVTSSDIDSDIASLLLSVVSSDQAIIANADITISTTGNFHTIAMTPLADANGEVTITVGLSDGSLSTDQSFTLKIVAVNDLPFIIAAVADATEDARKTLDVAVLFDDIEGDILSFTVNNKPDWMTVNGNVLSGKPQNEDVGLNQMTITAADQGGVFRNTFDFMVVNTNDAPVLKGNANSLRIFADDLFTYNFPTNNYEDEDVGDELTFTFENLPTWASASGLLLSGTPAESDAAEYSITLTATDKSGVSVTDTFLLTVEVRVYDVAVVLSGESVCAGQATTVNASGAFDYNWYDSQNKLLQEGGSVYVFSPSAKTTLLVEGVDGNGTTTVDKFEIEIEVNPLPDASITANELELSVADDASYSYQWYFNDVAIEGANQATFSVPESGDYSVSITTGFGCSVISESVALVILSVNVRALGAAIYPVPAHDLLTLTFERQPINADYSIMNLSGQQMQVRSVVRSGEVAFDIESLPVGLYILLIQMDNGHKSMKFIKE